MTQRITKPAIWLAFALLIFALSFTRYADFDLWWHLKLGQSLLDNGALFRTDSFSWTHHGTTQFTGEWLADLIIWLSYAAGGMTGIAILKGTVLLGTLVILYHALRSRTHHEQTGYAAALFTLLLVLFAIRFRMFARPYIFSQLCLATWLLIIFRHEKNGNQRILLALLPLQIVWANLSVGAIFGAPLFLLYAIGTPAMRSQWFRSLLLLAAIAACSLLNPSTWQLYTLAYQLSADPFKNVIGEYQPLNAQILWGFGLRYTIQFQILAAGALYWLLIKRGWRNTFHLLICALFLFETSQQVRMIELSAMVLALFFVTPLEQLLENCRSTLPQHSRFYPVAAILLILLLIPLSIVRNNTYTFGSAAKEDTFPDGAIAFLQREQVSGTMFNSYSLGGYLIFKAPERPVFIDGRYRRLYNPDFYRLYEQAISNAAGWHTLEQRHPIDYALLEYDQKAQQFPLHLNSNPAWALVYWDNHSALYLKRGGKNQHIIDRYQYQIAKPAFYDFSYFSTLKGQAPAALLSAINADIARNPANQEPRLARAFLLYNMPGTDRSALLAEMRELLTLKPDLAFKHAALGMLLLDSGDSAGATAEAKKAIVLDPTNQGSRYLARKLGLPLPSVPSTSPHK